MVPLEENHPHPAKEQVPGKRGACIATEPFFLMQIRNFLKLSDLGVANLYLINYLITK